MLQAKWVLDHHGLIYMMTQYTPGLGEGWLRKKSDKKGGMMTTPALFTPYGAHYCYRLLHAHLALRYRSTSSIGGCCYIKSDFSLWDSTAA